VRRLPVRSAFALFFRERGTHLAAMVAYFALLSFVPLVFLALAAFGLAGQIDASSALVSYLEDVFPGRQVDEIVSIVRAVQENAATLSVIGGVGLIWSSVSLFSALESAFNIIYDRPNRSFLRGKALAAVYMGGALVVLFAGLTAGTLGYDVLRDFAPAVFGNRWVALALSVSGSALALFVFLLTAYYRLTNAPLTRRQVLPGAIVGAFFLELTLQALPLFVYVTSDLVAVQALGTTFLLLVWLYVMANVIVFGAALNHEMGHGAAAQEPHPPAIEDAAAPPTGAKSAGRGGLDSAGKAP
jgi:membrane protein